MKDIRNFLELAATTREGENLISLWDRAYDIGYENGRKSLLRSLEEKMEEKYEEGVERGMGLGREEGYTVAKGGFDHAIQAMKDREAQKKANTTESGTQTDPKTTTTSVFTQTNILAACTTTSQAQTLVV
jgi:flagellar biosynthesis/type III secretory pathway protein FliH